MHAFIYHIPQFLLHSASCLYATIFHFEKKLNTGLCLSTDNWKSETFRETRLRLAIEFLGTCRHSMREARDQDDVRRQSCMRVHILGLVR